MSALQSMLINSVWVLGLAGLLATFSYVDWYRTVRKWTLKDVFRRPLALAPFYLSLTCFCLGLLISQVLFSPPDTSIFSGIFIRDVSILNVRSLFNMVQESILIKIVVWAGFTLFFTYQSFQTIVAGRRHGWDAPID